MTTYYVRVTGSDAADGLGPATAWQTIDKAANTVAAGDTVYIGAGVYRELVTMDTAGSLGNIISYIGDVDGAQTGDPGLVMISACDSPGQPAVRSRALDLNDGKAFITFKYLIFEGNQSSTAPVHDDTSADLSYEAVTFDGCAFFPTQRDNIIPLQIDYNNGVTPTGADGLILKNCVLLGRIVYECLNNVTAHVNAKAVIENCLVIGDASYVFRMAAGSGGNSYSVGGVTIRNCTFIRATVSFEGMKNTTNPHQVYNCIWLIANYLIDGGSSAAGAVVEDNNFGFSSFMNIPSSGTVTNGGHSINGTLGAALLGGMADWPLYQKLGWSPYKPWELIAPTHALDSANNTSESTTDAYGNPKAMGRNTVIFRADASDAAASDPNSKWNDDTLASNALPTDSASCSTQGSTSSNYLKSEGTNFQSVGSTITQVRARIRGYVQNSNNRLDVVITTDAAAETLATISLTAEDVAAWTDWTTLTAPTGGWTVAAAQALEFVAFKQDANAGAVFLHHIELEATIATHGDAGAVEARTRPVVEASIVHSGSAAIEFAGAGYHDMLVPVSAASTTVSVYAYRDADYAGDNPILEVLNIPGYADQSDAQTGDAAEWEQLSVTFEPTAAGWCRVRLRSRDTSATGKCYFDDVTVA